MLYITSSHLLEFPFMLLTGMLLWGVCAILGAVRRLMCAGIWLSLGCDILMGIIWAALFCVSVTIIAEGRIRLYHPVLAAMGAIILKSLLYIPSGKYLLVSGLMQRLAKNRLIHALFR